MRPLCSEGRAQVRGQSQGGPPNVQLVPPCCSEGGRPGWVLGGVAAGGLPEAPSHATQQVGSQSLAAPSGLSHPIFLGRKSPKRQAAALGAGQASRDGLQQSRARPRRPGSAERPPSPRVHLGAPGRHRGPQRDPSGGEPGTKRPPRPAPSRPVPPRRSASRSQQLPRGRDGRGAPQQPGWEAEAPGGMRRSGSGPAAGAGPDRGGAPSRRRRQAPPARRAPPRPLRRRGSVSVSACSGRRRC